MAKGRVINKSISTSNKVNLGLRNPLDCLLYTWGLCHADDEGRIDGHATIYRATVAPALPGLTDSRVARSLITMEKAHLVTRYTVQGVMTVQFLDWDIHQTFKGFHRKPSHFPPEHKEAIITQKSDNHPTLPGKETKLNETKLNNTNNLPDFKTSGAEKRRFLVPIHQVIEYYKVIKGFDKIENWDKIYFSRYCRDAMKVLKIIPYCPSALKAIERVGEYFNKKELDWNLSTVVGYLPEYLADTGGNK